MTVQAPPALPGPRRPPAAGGRGRRNSPVHRAMERALDVLLAGGVAASLARRFGLQGAPVPCEHRVVLRGPPHPPLRVAFASDFHAGGTTHLLTLREAAATLAALEADLILLGGDFVVHHAREVEPLLPLLAGLRAPLGVWAVLGNHDLCTDDAYVRERLEDAGVRVLVNEGVALPAPWDDVWLCGLDDPTRGRPDAAAALAGAPAHRLVLMHSPDGLHALRGHAFALALCGHVHGGQIALPGDRILHFPEGTLNRLYPHGLHALPDGGTLLVSRGVGCSGLPIRLGARAEVHACTLEWE